MKLKLLLYFLLLIQVAIAHTKDSLLAVYHRVESGEKFADPNRVDLYNKLFTFYLDEHVDSALYFGNLAEKLAHKINYEKGLASYYNNMGIYHKDIGNYYTALLWYHKYLEVAEKLQDNRSISSAYNNIGIVYKMQENSKLAFDYLNRSLQLKKQYNMNKDISSSLNNIGNVHINNKVWDSALYYYFQARDLNIQYDNKKFLCINLRNIAETYLNKKNYDSAQYYLEQAGKLMPMVAKDKKQWCQWYTLLGNYYCQTGNYSNALAYTDTSAQLVRKGNFKGELLDVYKLYGDLFHALKDDSKAFAYERNYNMLRDSMYKESISVQVSDLQQSYELKKLDSNLEKLRQQKYFISIIALLIGILLASAFYILQKRKQSIWLLDTKNKELQQLNEEKNNLIRLVAHDLKSPLSRIHMLVQLILHDESLSNEEKQQFILIIRDTSKETNDMIGKFLSLERSDSTDFKLQIEPVNLTELTTSKVNRFMPLAKEKDIALKYHVALSEPVLLTDIQCLRQILANLISNAIKYTPIGGEVTLNLMDDDNNCIFEVHDNGPGIKEEDQKKLFTNMGALINKPTGGESATGFGLFIVKTLVSRLKGEVWVKSKEGAGASFFVSLPKK